MLSVDSIQRGMVIDHIKAGKSMEIYKYLCFGELDCSVAIIKNVKSKKMGRKDIIKIEDRIDLDLDVLGFIDPNISINIIEDSKIKCKHKLSLPLKVVDVLKCKNPRCITSIEKEIAHIFILTNENKRTYRCIYCEQPHK